MHIWVHSWKIWRNYSLCNKFSAISQYNSRHILILASPCLIIHADCTLCFYQFYCPSYFQLFQLFPKLIKILPRRLTPWYNLSTPKIKRKTHKLEKKLEESCLVWQDSFKCTQEGFSLFKKRLLCHIDWKKKPQKKQNKHRVLFSTVSRLTDSHHSIEPCIPRALTSNDFMNYFNIQIILIRDYVLHPQI